MHVTVNEAGNQEATRSVDLPLTMQAILAYLSNLSVYDPDIGMLERRATLS